MEVQNVQLNLNQQIRETFTELLYSDRDITYHYDTWFSFPNKFFVFQLRYLQTLNSISAENNSTVIFPVPIDIMNQLMNGMNNRQPQYPVYLPQQQHQQFMQQQVNQN